MAFTGDSEILEDDEILMWRDGRTVDVGESLDGVLDGGFAGRLEYPADLDGSVVIAHERGGRCRGGVFVGEWTEQGCDVRFEEIVIASPGLFRV